MEVKRWFWHAFGGKGIPVAALCHLKGSESIEMSC